MELDKNQYWPSNYRQFFVAPVAFFLELRIHLRRRTRLDRNDGRVF
jgi:hypothetical protein